MGFKQCAYENCCLFGLPIFLQVIINPWLYPLSSSVEMQDFTARNFSSSSLLANGKLLRERMEIKIIICRIYACYKTNLSAFGEVKMQLNFHLNYFFLPQLHSCIYWEK